MDLKHRLESLDILRGFDLFLLVAVHPILVGISSVDDSGVMDDILYHFDHEQWVGFRLWDLIMPLFLFITGSAIPFSFDKHRFVANQSVYKHLFRRFVILWIIGMIIQGNLFSFDWRSMKLFSNTLQAIAIGYLFSSIFYLNFKKNTLYVIVALLLVVYTIPFLVFDDFSEFNNIAIRIDRYILGPFIDGAHWQNSNSWVYSKTYNYSWIWSSLTFTVSVMTGCFAGKYIKDNRGNFSYKIALNLAIIGVILVLVGLFFGAFVPIIKRIWTSTMVIYSSGICLILLATFFYLIDILQWKKPFSFLKIFGLNSLVAYFLGEFINFRPIVHQFTYGIENIFPDYQSLILNVGNVTILTLILWGMYRSKKFISI